MKTFKIVGNVLEIVIKAEKEFNSALAIVKSLTGKRFDYPTKIWSALHTQENLDTLLNNGFTEVFSTGTEKDTSTPIQSKTDYTPVEIPDEKLDARLYPYQKDGVRFIAATNGRCLIGDDCGLGKTAQALSYCQLHKELRPVLIVCPATLKINWKREILLWTKERCTILSGKTPSTIPSAPFVVINYDILSSWQNALQRVDFKMIIGDEIQMIANTSQRTTAFKDICKQIQKRVFLSGTPIKNRAIEFYNALNLIDKKTFSSKKRFGERFSVPSYDPFKKQIVYKKSRNMDELNTLLKPVMIRRLKGEVLKDLPTKTRVTIPLTMDTSMTLKYKNASDEFIEWASKNEAKTLAGKKHIETLKQYAYAGKRQYAISWLQDFLDSNDEKVIVFCWHKEAIADLVQVFKKYAVYAVVVDGSTSLEQRQKNVDAFQNDPECRMFIGNIIAAGTGITLTAASAVVFLELGWSPADHIQAEDRALRIGQKNAVTCYYLIAEGTIEEDLVQLIDEKAVIVNRTMDGVQKTFFDVAFSGV